MGKPKILIVGAGAVGLSQGYHLSFAADITFLVRPGRKSAFVGPKKLYDYRENVLRTFSGYQVIESTSEVAGTSFLFVLDTLDGHTARSPNGQKTLRDVGDLIRGTSAFVLYDAVGVGMRTHYASTMGIPKEKCLFAASMLAHQPTPMITIPETADKNLVAQADLLYIGRRNEGLTIFKSDSPYAKTVTETYAANGKLIVGTFPLALSSALDVTMIHLVVWYLDDNQPFPHLYANTELWNLLLRAQSEVFSLPRAGWTGWLLSWVMRSWATAKVFRMLGDEAKPLAYHEFNKFHHGGKVVLQDVDMLRDLVREGELSGRKMVALREVVERAELKVKAEIGEDRSESSAGREGLRKRA